MSRWATYDNINGGPFMLNVIGLAGQLMYLDQIFCDNTKYETISSKCNSSKCCKSEYPQFNDVIRVS